MVVVTAEKGCDLAAALAPHLKNRCELVVAAGGDGTISDVTGLLAGTNVDLGVVPG